MASKILTGFLICLMVATSASGLLYPKKSYALFGIGDIVHDPIHTAQTVAGWILEKAEWAAKHIADAADFVIQKAKWLWDVHNSALKTALAVFRKKLTDEIVNEIVQWIQGGGKPKFVTDWKSFIKNAGDTATIQVLEELEKQGQIPAGLTDALCNPNWAIWINMVLRTPQTFGTRAKCTLSDVETNFENFMNDFNNGGWAALIKITETQNNPYGLYLMTNEEILKKKTEAINAAVNQAKSGAGFLGDRVCKEQVCPGGETYTGTWKEDELGAECGCTKWETRTPGKIVADTLGFSVTKDMQWLITNEEWESYVVAITDALINRLTKEGIMAITSADVSGGGPSLVSQTGLADTTPPITKASAFDAWHVKLEANEDAFIYYTTDGTTPTISSKTYTGPIKIEDTTTIKWFGMDYSGNREGVHTKTFYPPLNVDKTEPTSIAKAAGENAVILTANMPATIYYTTDGTTPTTNSPRYIKVIENIEPITPLQWFAASSQGTTETTIHQLALVPPFPNDELKKVYDFITPQAKIDAPNSVNATYDGATGEEVATFTIDPSLSNDPDDTDKIIMYEWDFDNDGVYDWWTVDYNRDGVFDESQYKSDYYTQSMAGEQIINVGNGFEGLEEASTTTPGVLKVKYRQGQRTITLRVTDDEGLYDVSSVTVNVQ